ncbi:MAG: DUF4249 family protein [Phaeodactylibacter sp.]|nr:DUF4249 family protein [Phaeodactylibacter sp.]MCB9274067.1 DUF4249 family protein [Lewinellaceae bacterium]
MRILGIFALLVTASFFLGSCSTDFELEADWKDIPVVYSFISTQDTAHYVRIEKAFLEPGGNALEIAKVTDSIYYANITVELQNLNTGQSYTLQRVDGNDEGYPKDDGLFANNPNVLYKIPASVANFQGGNQIRLTINRGDELEPVTAETTVLNEIDSISSSPTRVIRRWLYQESKKISWRPGPEAKIFDVRFIFYYKEAQPTTPTVFERKSVEWVVDRSVFNETNSDRVETEAFGESLYSFLGNAIPKSNGEIRQFDGMELVVTGAGEELYQYVRVARSNTGITSSQSIPTYSNMSEGLGIMTSRYTMRRPGFRLQEEALDSLISGVYTKGLGFR